MKNKAMFFVLLMFVVVCSGAVAEDRVRFYQDIWKIPKFPPGTDVAVILEEPTDYGRVSLIRIPADLPFHANVIFESDEGGRLQIAKYGSLSGQEHLLNFLGMDTLDFTGPFKVYLKLLGENPEEYAGQYYSFLHTREGKTICLEKVPAW